MDGFVHGDEGHIIITIPGPPRRTAAATRRAVVLEAKVVAFAPRFAISATFQSQSQAPHRLGIPYRLHLREVERHDTQDTRRSWHP